jgi:hypothetical protein
MGTIADLLDLVRRAHSEFETPTVDPRHFGLADDAHACGSRRQMAYVDPNAYGALARLEIRLDRIERRILHHHDHDGRRKDVRQHGVLEAAGKVLRLDLKGEGAFGANGYLFHPTFPR